MSRDEAQTVAVDAVGDVVAAGITSNDESVGSELTVVKVSGVTGAVRWQNRIKGGAKNRRVGARAVLTSQDGNVVVAGATSRTESLTDFVVAKFAGSDGREVWRLVARGLAEDDGVARSLAVDAHGDLFAAGEVGGLGFTVVKIAGESGRELWRQVIFDDPSDTGTEVAMLATDTHGDVVAVGSVGNGGFTAVKFHGEDGRELWRAVPEPSLYFASHVRIDVAGDVIAAGPTGVIKFRGTTGEEIWRRQSAEVQPKALAIDGHGDIVTTGGPGVIKLSGATGEELWRTRLCGPDLLTGPTTLAIDGNDDVAVGGISAAGATIDLAVSVLRGADGGVRWCQVLDGPAHGDDVAKAVATTATGDVIAAGVTENIGSGADFTLIRYRGTDGNEEWRRLINGASSFSGDAARAVGTDSAGDIVAVGETENFGTGRDFTVVKLRKEDGTPRWRQTLSGDAPGGADGAVALAIDRGDAVVAAGLTQQAGTGGDLTVAKLAPTDGAEIWRWVMDGGAQSVDAARAVAVDAAGDVFVAGGITQPTTAEDFAVFKLSGADGSELWRFLLNGTADGDDVAVGLVVAENGDVGVVGLTESRETGPDLVVVKLGGLDGAQRWQRTLNGDSPDSVDFARAVAVDSSGDLVIVGYTNGVRIGPFDSTRGDLLALKLDGTTGDEVWRATINGTHEPSTDDANAVAIDLSDDVVLAGSLEEANQGLRFTVIKLNGRTGREQWRYVAGGGNSQAAAVCTDPHGDVLSTGFTINSASHGFTVVKLAGLDGEELWRRNINGRNESGPVDFGYGIVAVADGHAVAVGSTLNRGTGFDFTVVRLNGADGTLDCVGDCDLDGEVLIGELITGVNITLERALPDRCTAFDATGDGAVSVDELVRGVDNALRGCRS